MTEAVDVAVAFVARLRIAGLRVPVQSVLTFTRALDAVGPERRDRAYWAGRATLLTRPEDIDVYDAVFESFWRGGAAIRIEPDVEVVEVAVATDDGSDDSDEGPSAAEPEVVVRYSAREILRHKDFGLYTAAELDEAKRLIAAVRLTGALRRSRRMQRSHRRRGRPDVRRTVRAAMRTGGEAVRRPRMEASLRPRRVVILCDVSGSMEPYARALMRFVHAAVVGGASVEAFTLGTRLTRVTRELSSRNPDSALRAAADAVPDWSGGTRLGEAIGVFNDRWGIRGMARGAVVVILSDGWDRGDPEGLAEQMARLRRVAYRVVWVNPLRASPGYAPLARGMAAALPFVDEFVDGHSLASLETLAEVVGR